MGRWVRRLGWPTALAMTLGAAATAARAEIAVMTRDRLAEAEEAGRRAVKEDQIVFSDTCRTKGKNLHAFDVTITTPFSSVAYAAFEAKRKETAPAPDQWPIDPPEKQSVIVTVDPAALLPVGLPPALPVNVKKVVLRRGEAIVEPLRADTHEVRFPEFREEYRTRRGGAYYFPLEPFASERGDLEIVVIAETAGSGDEAVLKMKRTLLAKLR